MHAIVLKVIAAATGLFGAWIPGLGTIVHGLKVASYVVTLATGAFAAAYAVNWWHSDKITIAQSDQRCADAVSVATVAARAKALDERERALNQRASQVETDEAALKTALEQMERDRAESRRAGDDGVLVRADDEWLQRWRGVRPGAGAGGRR